MSTKPIGHKILNVLQSLLAVAGIIYLAMVGRVIAGLWWQMAANDSFLGQMMTYDGMRKATTVIGLVMFVLVLVEYLVYAESKVESIELAFPLGLIAMPNLMSSYQISFPFQFSTIQCYHNPTLILVLTGLFVWELAWNAFLDDADFTELAEAEGLDKVKLVGWYALRVIPVTGIPIYLLCKANGIRCAIFGRGKGDQHEEGAIERLRATGLWKSVSGVFPAANTAQQGSSD